MNPAKYLRDRGWGVGSVLRGEPIFHEGREIERARHVVITAVGEERVLARTKILGENAWSRETVYTFDCRGWSLSKDN